MQPLGQDLRAPPPENLKMNLLPSQLRISARHQQLTVAETGFVQNLAAA